MPCEKIFGGSAAPLQRLRPDPEYLEFFRCHAAPPAHDFLYAPADQGSPSAPPRDGGPSSRPLGAVSAVSPPPSPGRPSPRALAMCAGAGPAWPAVLPATPGPPRSPAGGGAERRHGRAPSPANPRRSIGAFASGGAHAQRRRPDGWVRRGGPRLPFSPCPRPSSRLGGRERSLWASLGPSCSLCPGPALPAKAPLLARLGVVACEVVFPSAAVRSQLLAPCVLPCFFPCL